MKENELMDRHFGLDDEDERADAPVFTRQSRSVRQICLLLSVC